MATNTKLGNDSSGQSVDITLYRSMIDSLLYLTASQPDIAFSVGVCVRFQSNLKESHLNDVKRIIKYVSGTCDFGLFYSKESNLSLAGYSDADWVLCLSVNCRSKIYCSWKLLFTTSLDEEAFR